VNDAVRRHISPDNFRVVMVSGDAEGLRRELLSGEPSTITYDGEKPAELLEEDAVVGAYELRLAPERVTITPIEDVFR